MKRNITTTKLLFTTNMIRSVVRLFRSATAGRRSERSEMAQPAVHFEIIGRDPGKLRGFLGELFGWEFDTSGTVSEAVSEPTNYGFLDFIKASDGSGIRGGVGGGEAYDPHVVVYVGVADIEATLQTAEKLGGRRVIGPVTAPNGLVIGHFTDPEGNLIGLASAI
jgi:predicted enzyme related to lactoylglutathione lyase